VAEPKYSNLVKTLMFKKGRGGANAKELVFVDGDEIANFDFNFIVGVYDTVGDWAPDRGAHEHPFDEVLLFFGYDPNDMNYLGSDMNLSIGQEYEEHKFSVPMAAIAPKHVAHCPLVTEKVYRQFGHFHLALSAKYSGNSVKKEGTTDGHKYDHFMKPMVAQKGAGGTDAKQTVNVSGADLEGLNLNFIMGLYDKVGQWSQPSHLHPYNEVMVFFGHNVDNLSYLGADISVEIGPERERHTFNVPTVVAIPKGLAHFPVTVNKFDKPFRMMQIGLAPQYKSQ
jgi:hypothetical protein